MHQIIELKCIKNWIKINEESRGGWYASGSNIKFKTSILRSSLCDYADAYIIVKETIAITGAGDDDTKNDWMKEIKA